jgi:diguanylate cyclase (GGDEF)-like protein
MEKSIPVKHSLKFKIIVSTFIILTIIIGLLLYKSHKDQEEIIKMQEYNLNQIARDTIYRRFKVSYEILEVGITQMLVNPAIIETFAERDREELLNVVSKSYEKLEKAGVTQFHFHLPDNSSFLRVHKPEEYGDKLNFRKTITSINKDPEHKPIKGLEEGNHGLSLRYIHPIFFEEQYIGSVELGMDLGDRILNIFNNVSGGEWYLYSLKVEDNDFMIGTTLNDIYPLNSNGNTEDLLKGKMVVEYDSPLIIQLIPIKDFEGSYSYYLKRVFNNNELINLQKTYTRDSIFYSLIVSILGMVILWIMVHYMLKPLNYLEIKARKFMSGTLDEDIKIESKSEIGYLADTMEKMRLSLQNREERLKKLSFHDSLTNLYNRHYLEYLFKTLDERKSYPITILIADLDGLKDINDNKGHLEGDNYIKKSTEVMKKVLRKSDYLFRIGGDEFAFLLPKTDKEMAKKISKRVEAEISKYNTNIEKYEEKLSISIGVATCNNNCESLEKVMDLADKRMYKNKRRKKNMKFNEKLTPSKC